MAVRAPGPPPWVSGVRAVPVVPVALLVVAGVGVRTVDGGERPAGAHVGAHVGAHAAAPAAVPALPATSRAHLELKRTSEDGQEMLVATTTVNGSPWPARAWRSRSSARSVTWRSARTRRSTTARRPCLTPRACRAMPTAIWTSGSPCFRHQRSRVRRSGDDRRRRTLVHRAGGLPRALWSSRAPLAIVGTIAFLLLCVWGTYGFVVVQLAAMYHVNGEG